MAVVQVAMLVLALVATACLPAVVAVIICADELIDRLVCDVGERLDARRERRNINRLNRSLGVTTGVHKIDFSQLDQPDRPSIEQIAVELRRLGSQRLDAATQSPVWHRAVLATYDDQLREACRCLGVVEHLRELDGVDRDIERLRVEGELEAAGLILLTTHIDRRE